MKLSLFLDRPWNKIKGKVTLSISIKLLIFLLLRLPGIFKIIRNMIIAFKFLFPISWKILTPPPPKKIKKESVSIN